ncbi:MAG: YebC/PmpR family DNA-binding transcriptional regulator [Prosthecobacter sp.]
MAGHNKWSKIKRGKAIVDAKRGNAFSKLAKEITLAAKAGGGSPDMNARLRSAIAAAKAANVPNDNIDRAIKKGTGELASAALEEILYEAYGPGGVAMMIEIVTDNRNRSANDIRVLLSKNNGTFADSGSVAYMFQRLGEIRLDKSAATEDQLMEAALEAGADDITDSGDEWIVYTPTDKLFQVASALRDKNLSPNAQNLVYQPQTLVTISDVDTAKSLIRLYDLLDDYDDSQHIHANFEIDDSIADQLD